MNALNGTNAPVPTMPNARIVISDVNSAVFAPVLVLAHAQGLSLAHLARPGVSASDFRAEFAFRWRFFAPVVAQVDLAPSSVEHRGAIAFGLLVSWATRAAVLAMILARILFATFAGVLGVAGAVGAVRGDSAIAVEAEVVADRGLAMGAVETRGAAATGFGAHAGV